jgi:hypothetical protein
MWSPVVLRQLEPDIRIDVPLVQEATKYLGLGVSLQVLRVLLTQFRRVVVHPAEQLRNLCVLKNFSLGIFFGCYVGIYHASIFGCVLFTYSSTGTLVILVNLLLHSTEKIGLFGPKTDFMQQNNHSADQEISNILWNPEMYFLVHKTHLLPLTNPDYTLKYNFWDPKCLKCSFLEVLWLKLSVRFHFPLRTIWSVYLILLGLITLIIFCDMSSWRIVN